MARRRGADIWRDRYAKHAHRTFREAATRYLREFDGKDPRRQAYCAESLLPYIGELPLIEVTGEALTKFKEDRRKGQGAFEKPAMAGTINKELTFVVTVLGRACREWDWIPRVPKIRHVKGATRQAYPLTWDEQRKLFDALPTGWDQCAALFAVNTGVRKEELFGLRWRDRVELPELKSFVFILTDTKNGEDRAVICNSIARRAIENMRNARKIWRRRMREAEVSLATEKLTIRDTRRLERRIARLKRRLTCGYVFPSYNGYRIQSIGKIMTKAWKEAGLPDGRLTKKGIHNLRHTFCHRLRAAGVPDEDRDALSGHAKKSLTQHYAMPDIKRLQEYAERITKRDESVILRPVRSAL